MKKPLAFFRATLALLLAFAAVPGAACLRSCNAGAEDLACLRLCAQSHALLSENGTLPTLASADCGVDLQVSPVLVSVASFELPAPAVLAVIAQPVAVAEAGLAFAASSPQRGPPPLNSFSDHKHPLANAPPSFC